MIDTIYIRKKKIENFIWIETKNFKSQVIQFYNLRNFLFNNIMQLL